MNVLNKEEETPAWCPPSDAIQRLFRFDSEPAVDAASEIAPKPAVLTANAHSFTEEEFAKMPSTLMKAVRRTDLLLAQNELIRKAAIDTHNELKGIHTLMVRYARKHLKSTAENATESPQTSVRGFRRPCRISDAMCEFIGKPVGSASSRVEVNNAINEYIKAHKLIDPDNAQHILPDDQLWTLLSENAKGNRITYFSIQKYIKHHFLRI